MMHYLVYETASTFFYSDCSHRWEEVYFHKLGNAFLCREECHVLALYPVVDKEERDQMTIEGLMKYLEKMAIEIKKKFSPYTMSWSIEKSLLWASALFQSKANRCESLFCLKTP